MMIGGMGGSMPSMQAMQQMRERMFSKADGNGSGGLDASEFDAMVQDSPMAKMAPSGGIDRQEAFAKLDQDGSGELSAAELDSAHQEMMARLQTTLQRFGADAGGGAQASAREDSGWQTLLNSLSVSGSDDDGSSPLASTSDSAAAQLRALMAQISSTYSADPQGNLAGLLGTA
jgi:hypothetical protein